jgi:hypothetical protein
MQGPKKDLQEEMKNWFIKKKMKEGGGEACKDLSGAKEGTQKEPAS